MVIMVAKWLVRLQWWLLVQVHCVSELLGVFLLHILILLWALKGVTIPLSRIRPSPVFVPN